MAYYRPALVCDTYLMVFYRFQFNVRKPKRKCVCIFFGNVFCLETDKFGKLRSNFQGQTKQIQVSFHAFELFVVFFCVCVLIDCHRFWVSTFGIWLRKLLLYFQYYVRSWFIRYFLECAKFAQRINLDCHYLNGFNCSHSRTRCFYFGHYSKQIYSTLRPDVNDD